MLESIKPLKEFTDTKKVLSGGRHEVRLMTANIEGILQYFAVKEISRDDAIKEKIAYDLLEAMQVDVPKNFLIQAEDRCGIASQFDLQYVPLNSFFIKTNWGEYLYWQIQSVAIYHKIPPSNPLHAPLLPIVGLYENFPAFLLIGDRSAIGQDYDNILIKIDEAKKIAFARKIDPELNLDENLNLEQLSYLYPFGAHCKIQKKDISGGQKHHDCSFHYYCFVNTHYEQRFIGLEHVAALTDPIIEQIKNSPAGRLIYVDTNKLKHRRDELLSKKQQIAAKVEQHRLASIRQQLTLQ